MKKLVLLLVCVVILFGGKIKNVPSVSKINMENVPSVFKINMENAIERKFKSTEPAQLTLKIPIDVDPLQRDKRLTGGISFLSQHLVCSLFSSDNTFYQAVELNDGGKKTITMNFNGFSYNELFVDDGGITYYCAMFLSKTTGTEGGREAYHFSDYLEEVNDDIIQGLFKLGH